MSDLPTSNELLPCPFCGGDAEPIRIGSHYQSAQIQCCNCGCLIESAGEGARSWDAWNRRAAAEPADDLYALLVRRGYAQHEAHAIAFGDKLAVLSSSPPPPAGLNKVLEPEKYGNGYRVSLIFLSEENAAAAYLELDRPELTKGAAQT